MPEALRSITPLDERLAHRLGVAGRLVRTLADAKLSELGVSASALGVLLRLVEADGLTQAELSRRQCVEAPTMCRMVDGLAREGLVERRPDATDRRATRVHLTSEGRVAAETGAVVVDAIERRAFAGLDDDEQRLLADLLGRVLDQITPSRGAPT